MIIQEKLPKDFDLCPIRAKIWLCCDYCGQEFERVKKSIQRLNKIIQKDSCGEKSCTIAKKKDVFLKLYGNENLFESKTFKKKQKQTNLEKYGTEEYFDSDDFKTKRKSKLIEKYGVDNPLQSEEIKLKQQQTCLELYGVGNYSQHEDFKDKVSETNLVKYGFKSAMSNPKVLKKRKETSKKKYGKESYTQTEEYWEQRKNTCLKVYGVEHPSQLKENRDKAKATNLERYGVENYAQTDEFRERYTKTCMAKYGVPSVLCLKQCQKYGKTQNKIGEWLNSFGFDFKRDYSILGDQELDLYDGNLNLAIEYCGLFWHNEASPNPRAKNYHYNKYLKCAQKGIRLITVFEDEWKNKEKQCKGVLLSVLGKQTKIHGRKCSVREVDRSIFNNFIDENHILGKNNLGLVFFILEYKNEVVGGMSLGRHHRNKKNLVLDRLCFKSEINVTGGTSKLFKQCTIWAKDQGYENLISWSDNRWSQGNIYNKLNFSLEQELPPDYSYVNVKKPYLRLSKQSQMKSNTGCPKDTTEREWCLQQGLARMWDCGKKRWKYSIV